MTHSTRWIPLALAFLLGCGGSHHNDTKEVVSPATSLAYQDPTAGSTEWKLVKDAASTGTHLVLDLVGPSDGTKYRGIGFTLQADSTRIRFARFQDAQGNPLGFYADNGVFLDRNPAGTADVTPVLQAGAVTGDRLMVGIYQKYDDELFTTAPTLTSSAKDCSGILLKVAIDLDPDLKAAPGTLPLTILKARAIPEHITTLQTRKLVDVPLKVGSITLK